MKSHLLFICVLSAFTYELFETKPEVNMFELNDFRNIQSIIKPHLFNLLFIYDKNEETSIEIADILKDVIHPKFQNFYQLIAIGCHHKGNQVPELPICQRNPGMPSLPVASGMAIDPEDNSQIKEIPFNSGSLTEEGLKNFILRNIPHKVTTIKDAKDFKRFQSKKDLNSFYLFSEKSKIPPTFKTISMRFSEKFKFAFIQKGLEDAEEMFSIVDFPSLYLCLDFDTEGNKQERQIVKMDGDQDFEAIVKFLSDHESKKAKKQTKQVSREK